MQFTYKEIIAILLSIYEIDQPNMLAFRGRMQHMQRMGFPPGVNTGRGRPSCYAWRELFLLGLAFEYLEIGSTPERSVLEIMKFENQLLDGLASVILHDQQPSDANQSRHLLYVELSALSALKTNPEQRSNCSIFSPSEIFTAFSGQSNSKLSSPYSIVDLRQFFSIFVDQVSKTLEMPRADTLENVVSWATDMTQTNRDIPVAI